MPKQASRTNASLDNHVCTQSTPLFTFIAMKHMPTAPEVGQRGGQGVAKHKDVKDSQETTPINKAKRGLKRKTPDTTETLVLGIQGEEAHNPPKTPVPSSQKLSAVPSDSPSNVPFAPQASPATPQASPTRPLQTQPPTPRPLLPSVVMPITATLLPVSLQPTPSDMMLPSVVHHPNDLVPTASTIFLPAFDEND
jgi:hypothetical protein